MKALIINPAMNLIAEYQFPDDPMKGANELQEIVGGYIERAFVWPVEKAKNSKWYPNSREDILWCNEEGLYKFRDAFFIEGIHQWVPGPAIILGYKYNEEKNCDCTMSLDELASKIRFGRLPGNIEEQE